MGQLAELDCGWIRPIVVTVVTVVACSGCGLGARPIVGTWQGWLGLTLACDRTTYLLLGKS